MEKYYGASLESLVVICISTIAIFVIIIPLTRMSGKRSFSKMSSFDFAATIAIGSIIASAIITSSVTLIDAGVALFTIFSLKSLVAWLRRFETFRNMVDNDPLLLMDGETILHKNLRKAQVTESDLRSKLREANVLDLSQVRAVVFETTGDIAVLHTSDPGQELQEWLLEGVQLE